MDSELVTECGYTAQSNCVQFGLDAAGDYNQPNSSTLGFHLDDDDGGFDCRTKHLVCKASGRQRGIGCADTTRPADLPVYRRSWYPSMQPRKKETSFTQLPLHDAQRKQSGVGCTDSNFEPEAKPIDPEVLEILGLDQLASDDEDNEVEVEADYPKPLPEGMVDDDDHAEALNLSGLDQLASDDEEDEVEVEADYPKLLPEVLDDDFAEALKRSGVGDLQSFAEVLEILGLDQLASEARNCKLPELEAEVLEVVETKQTTPVFRVSWADMLEEDSYDDELERLHDQDWTKAATASLRTAEGSQRKEKQERKMQSSKSGGEHTSQGMTELMPKQAAGHRPGVLTGNGAGDGSGGGPGAGEGLSRSARRRQRRKAKTHKPR